MVAPELSSLFLFPWRQKRLDPGGEISCHLEDFTVAFTIYVSVLNSFSCLVSYKAYFTLIIGEQRQEGVEA